MKKVKELIEKLNVSKSLTLKAYKFILDNYKKSDIEFAKTLAIEERHNVYGNTVFIRGLIEITNYCKNGCHYCGINRENKNCTRYRLTSDEILKCCEQGYSLGFRTFVLQGGEDNHFTDELVCNIVQKIKEKFPECAVTLSLGEKSYESYKMYKEAGADRYLLRHETADSSHYSKLHPSDLSLETRLECLHNLKKLGFQTGCGIMVGRIFSRNVRNRSIYSSQRHNFLDI